MNDSRLDNVHALSDVMAAPLGVRVHVAERHDLPADWQRALHRDKAAKVRAALAGNPALLPDLQDDLMRTEPRVTVRCALAKNPTLTTDSAARLTGVRCTMLRRNLIGQVAQPSITAIEVAEIKTS